MEEREILNKQIADELMKIKGETRGFNLIRDAEFILKEKGEEGLKKIEEELEKLGYPIKYKQLKVMNFYPAGLRLISLLAIKKLFAFEDEDFRRVGAFLPRISFFTRFFIKHFFSLEKTLKESSKIWKKFWLIGDLVTKEYDLKKRYALLELQNFNLHPLFCRLLEGYLESIATIVLGKGKIEIEEKSCFFRGGKNHQFLVSW